MNHIICGMGFVGRNLKEYLESQGQTVIRMPTSILWNKEDIKNFLKLYEPYKLYYLAAYGNLHGQNDVHEIYNVVLNSLHNVLDASLDTKCEALLTAGTSSEYGVKLETMSEGDILEPYSFYGAAKAAATHLSQVWALHYGTPIVVFRPASITGVGEQSIHLIPTLIRSCLNNEEIEFIGEPTHDYINVKDIARALFILGGHAKERKGEIFNIGTGKEYTNLQILQIIENLTNSKANITGKTYLRPFEGKGVWRVDSMKLHDIGWFPHMDIYSTLKEMIGAFT